MENEQTNVPGKSPFPRKLPNGKTVVNERCTCGLLRSEHTDGPAGAYGHGPSVKCAQFTWASFVMAGEKH